MMDPRPRHHRPRQMTQHPQPLLWATACRVEMGSNWMGTMGAVGHNEGECNEMMVKWEQQWWRNGTPPTPSLTNHCSWGGLCMEWQQQQWQWATVAKWWNNDSMTTDNWKAMSMRGTEWKRYVSFFLPSFIFIWLTNFLGTNFNYW